MEIPEMNYLGIAIRNCTGNIVPTPFAETGCNSSRKTYGLRMIRAEGSGVLWSFDKSTENYIPGSV